MRERLAAWREDIAEDRGDLVGYDAVSGPVGANVPEPPEIRMRYAARCRSQEAARQVGEEVEALYLCGPSGGGGVSCRVREVIGVASGLMPAGVAHLHVKTFEA